MSLCDSYGQNVYWEVAARRRGRVLDGRRLGAEIFMYCKRNM